MHTKKLCVFIACTAMILLFSACPEAENGELVPVTGITLDKTEEQVMEVGELLSLTATIIPGNATEKGVTWRSLNNNVSVFVEGSSATIYALFPGETVIYAAAEHGAFLASCPVTVPGP